MSVAARRLPGTLCRMVFFMNGLGNGITVSGSVRRSKPSLGNRRLQWSAARGTASLSSRQSRAPSHRAFQGRVVQAGQWLRFAPHSVPSFSVDPRCCVGAVQRQSHKARVTVQRPCPPFGRMRHNLAAHRTRASGRASQPSSAARRWLPR